MNPYPAADRRQWKSVLRCLGRYRAAHARLEAFKAKEFYHGTPVWVEAGKYRGAGVAVTDHQCPPDQVAVALPNGNTWWYSLSGVRRYEGKRAP